MTKYRYYFEASASTSVVVEADTEEEARDRAYEARKPSSCHVCPQVGDWELASELPGASKYEDDYRVIAEEEGE